MAVSMTNTVQNYFELFVTCIDKSGPMLKIWGQTDRTTSTYIEQLLKDYTAHFEKNCFVSDLTSLSVGTLCCAKYKDGLYYRAQIINVRQLPEVKVDLKFIDYGNIELINVEDIRLFDKMPVALTTLKAQATDFILANVIHIHRSWNEASLAFVHQDICYMELQSTILGVFNNYRFIRLLFHQRDFADYLIEKGLALPIPLATQELVMHGPRPMLQITEMMPVTEFVAPLQQVATTPIQVPELCSFKTLPLETNSEHMVYVSYVEDGPYLFAVQLQSCEDMLEKLMNEINQLPLLSLTEQPVPGYPCMARCLEDGTICRAVVISLVEDKCKIYYVDFGNTDILPFSSIFQIPFKYVLPKVMSMRFTLAGLKKMNVTNDMKCAFKEYVTNKLLKLKVLRLDTSPVIQYCELYDDNKSIMNILYESATQYNSIQISKGMKYNVIVSYIEGCKKFFVQLKECSDSLNSLMLALSTTSENAVGLDINEAQVGIPCVAFYSADNQWYRAQILAVTGTSVTVRYVDYGNEEIVDLRYLKRIDPNFIKILPIQAIECCLCGYQNMSFNNDIESVFESLTLECEFTIKVINKQNNDILLVDLFDCTDTNVAALLIEKLAAQKSQISPLASNQLTKSILSQEENIPSSDSEKSFSKIKSPRFEKENLSWRQQSNNKQFKNAGNERKSWRTNTEKKSWRNTEDSPTGFRNSSYSRTNERKRSHNKKRDQRSENNTWSGDKQFTKSERTNPRNFRNSRSFEDNDRSDKFPTYKKPFERNSSRDNTNWPSGSESEKSYSGNSVGSRSGKSIGNKKSFKQAHKDDTHRKVELPPQELAALEEQFTYIEISPGLIEDISISWFYDPENFYCQILSYQKEFREMMSDIQSAYNGRSPLNTAIPVCSSVIAEFKDDSVLYRAIILENKYPFYKVQYVDFGNISLVNSNKIFQVEKKFMKMPMQAIKCGISNINAVDKAWPVSAEIDNIFNKDSFSCTFENFVDDKYTVQLYNDNITVKQQLIDSGIAVDNESSSKISDDPVELYLLIRQTMRVRLSNIFNFMKFYAQIDKPKADYTLSYINSYMQSADINTLQGYDQEQVIPGTACIAKINEETWYRAVVMESINVQEILVSYPDTGGIGQHTTDELYVLPAELCAFWYQAFECSLSYVTPDVLTEEDFKLTWEGKEVIMYVDNVEEDRLIVTLYSSDGKQLNFNISETSAYPAVDPLCPLPVFTTNLSVWVSHTNNVNSIYLQRECDSEALELLLSNMFAHYDSNGEVVEVAADELYSVKSSDANWYRARIEDINDDDVKALYVDYGNNELIPKTDIKALEKTFYEPHELALLVTLNLKEISPDLTNKLKELTDGQLLQAKLVYGESSWTAELFNNNVSINQTLIDLQLAAPHEAEATIDKMEANETPEPIPNSDSQADVIIDETRAQVTITHIDSPSEFYVQLVANENSIVLLQNDLQERISSLSKLEGADIGVLCAAKYSVDDLWYRAEVLDADTDITTVRFVDYGNTDVIDNHTGELKTLPADLLAINKYARKCSLNIKPIKDDEWTQEACEIFETVLSADTIYADIVYQDEKNKTYVELYVNGENIATQLLSGNLAVVIVRDDEEHIANNTGFVSHLNSPAEFWIQLESSVPDLEMIADRLASANTFSDLNDLSPGILCAANFPDDEMWYRARILSNTVAGIEVLFIDYGNSSTAMNLKLLPEDLVQMPALAQKCSLNKPASVTQWSDQATVKFQEISADGVTIFSIKKLTAGETSTVELFINDNNIAEQLLSLCEVSANVERIPPIGEVNYVNVHVTHIESPSLFWVQQLSDYEKIEEINETLATGNCFKQLTNWNSNTICAALYADSGIWYRAKILEYVEEYEVLLIDYGNVLFTNEIRALPANLETIPPLAIKCTLELPEASNERNTSFCTKFMELFADGYAECQLEFLDNADPRKVRVFYDGKNVYDEICSESVESTTFSDVENLNAANQLCAELTSTLNITENEKEFTSSQQTQDDDSGTGITDSSQFTQSDITTSESELKNSAVESSAPKDNICKYETINDIEQTITDILDQNKEQIVTSEMITNKLESVNTLNNETESHDQRNKQEQDYIEQTKLTTAETNEDSSLSITEEKIADEDNNLEISINKDNISITDEQELETNAKLITTTKEICNKSELSATTDENTSRDDKKEIATEEDSNVEISNKEGKYTNITNDSNESEDINSLNQIKLSEETSKIEETRTDVSLDNDLASGEKEENIIRSRPATPHCDKIVPGCISRGDLEEVTHSEVSDTENLEISTDNHNQNIPGPVINKTGDDIKELCDIRATVLKEVSESVSPQRPSTPKAPSEEKIVPGAISRGIVMEE